MASQFIDLPIGGSSSSGSLIAVSGSRAAPNLITAAAGIAFTSTASFTKIYIAGSGGPITVTKNPQIAAGTADGQVIILQSTNGTNTVTLANGTGLVLNGTWVGGLSSSVTLSWDLVNWVEIGRQ